MNRTAVIAVAGSAAALIAISASPTHAQPYPAKPVCIVTTQPGSSAELMGWLIALGLAGALGPQLVIDNRGLVAAEIVARAPGDGCTVLLYQPALDNAVLPRQRAVGSKAYTVKSRA